MDKIRSAFAEHWQFFLAVTISIAALCLLLMFRLGTITRHFLSTAELASHKNDATFHGLIHNPINAPYKLVDFLFIRTFGVHNVFGARIGATLFALLACVLFFIIMYRWHGLRSAALATTLFGTSGWILHVGRLGTGDSTLLVIPLALILFASWLNSTPKHGLALLYMTLASGLALFTPGAVWFLIATYAMLFRPITKHLANAKMWEKATCLVALLFFVVLLACVIFRSPHLYKSWLDLPFGWPAPLTMSRQWVDSITFLFLHGPSDASLWLAHIPILDVFTTLMCLVGGYFYAVHYKNLRSHVLVAFLVIGSILVALNGPRAMSFVVPIAYLLTGTGLTYFLRQWLSVFPRNPLARGLGIGLIVMIVGATAVYHIASYFVAWRYSPDTIAVFRERP